MELPTEIASPPILKTPEATGRPTSYTQQLGQDILMDIATSADSIDKVAQRHGIDKATFYRWTLVNEKFCDAYVRALENRMLVLGGDISQEFTHLKAIVEDDGRDPRDRHVRLQYLDKKWNHLQWLMSKHNRKLYGDKLDTTMAVTVQPTAQREAAWQARAEDAETVDNS
jgi:ADP-ribose pyrophosphatase YjhB (NUDIX family)